MQTKITIDQKGLKNALAVLATVVPSKSSMPILGDVLLSYDEKKSTFALTASDGEKWLTIECEQKGERFVNMIDDDRKDAFRGVCLNFKDLREAIALLPTGQLLTATFDDASHVMKVDYQIGMFSMPWEECVEYPAAPKVAEQGSVDAVLKATLATAQLLPWMKQARCCVASDVLRPVMEAVCLDVNHEGVTVVSSDGHTLYKKVLYIGTGWLAYGNFAADGSAKVLVPKGVLQTLDAAYSQTEEVTLTVDTQRMEWQSEGISLVCRLIEGHYPNYNSVIPKDNPYVVEIDGRSLSGALRRLSLFSNEASNMAVLERDGDKLLIRAEDINYSKKGQEHVAMNNGDTTMPDGYKIGVKISRMVELLGLVSTDTAVLYFGEPTKAALIKEETKNQDLTLLIMPMALNVD